MAKPGDVIHIPLRTNDAIALLGHVKPTSDMPRPGGKLKKPAKAKLKRSK